MWYYSYLVLYCLDAFRLYVMLMLLPLLSDYTNIAYLISSYVHSITISLYTCTYALDFLTSSKSFPFRLRAVAVAVFFIPSPWSPVEYVHTNHHKATTMFIIRASASMTVTNSMLVRDIQIMLQPVEIHAGLGSQMLAATWLMIGFSIASALAWVVGSCCCCF